MFEILYRCYPYDILEATELIDDIMENYLKKGLFAPEEFERYGDVRILRIMNACISKCLSPATTQRPELDWLSLIVRCSIDYIEWFLIYISLLPFSLLPFYLQLFYLNSSWSNFDKCKSINYKWLYIQILSICYQKRTNPTLFGPCSLYQSLSITWSTNPFQFDPKTAA